MLCLHASAAAAVAASTNSAKSGGSEAEGGSAAALSSSSSSSAAAAAAAAEFAERSRLGLVCSSSALPDPRTRCKGLWQPWGRGSSP